MLFWDVQLLEYFLLVLQSMNIFLLDLAIIDQNVISKEDSLFYFSDSMEG